MAPAKSSALSSAVKNVASGTIPSLDGIRTLAVALVFFAHGGLEQIVPGGLGVTIFFVLSGYLITTLMRVEHARTGTIHYRQFYLRRLLRLMPPLFIVATLAGFLSLVNIIDGDFTAGGLFSTLFYFGNYFVIAQEFSGLPAGLGVIWSLAIEEHYYLFYPPLALLLLGVSRVRLSIALLATLCAAVLAWRYWLVFHGASPAYLTMATDTRVDAILIGCLMGMWRNPWLDKVASSNALRDAVLAIICGTVLLGTLFYRDEVFRLTLRYTLQSLSIAPLIYLAVVHANRWPFRWLSARPLVYLGTISYTLYLAHHVVLLGVAKHGPELNWFWLMFISAALTVAIAEAMRRWVERPCAELRQRLHRSVRVETRLSASTP